MVKSFLYMSACVLIFFALIRVYDGSLSSQKAAAFEWEKTVNVYFGNSATGSSEDCSKVFPLPRTIPNAESFGPGALEALLRGTTPTEEDQGYNTALNKGIVVQKFDIRDDVAYVDFDQSFNQDVAGSCRVEAIKSQIETTLNQFPDIDSVVLSVNGETEGILEP